MTFFFQCFTLKWYKKAPKPLQNQTFSKKIKKIKKSCENCLTNHSFAMSGITFEENYVIDDRTKNIKDLIAKADLIYLMGGRTLVQSAFFDKIKLKTMLENYNGVIIGESAGTINMAENAYESREDISEKSHWYKGLGLTKYNIEPHFSEKNIEQINLTLKPDSLKSSFIALENRSYIMIKDDIATLHGNAWLFSNGDYHLINKVNKKQRMY